MKVSNVETESSVAAITFTAADNLNLITIATQNVAIVNDTASVSDYPAVLKKVDTTNLFYSEDS